MMKLTKSHFALALALSSTQVDALTPDTKSFIRGFYAGVELGYIHEGHGYKVHKSGRLYGFGAGPTTKSHKEANALLSGIFAGYRHNVGPLFVGVEVSANLNNSRTNTSFIAHLAGPGLTELTSHHVRARYNVIPVAVIGMPLSAIDGMNLYGKLGSDITTYHYKFTETNSVGDINKKSSSQTIGRFLMGFGVEYAINKYVSTRFETTYSFGKRAKFRVKGKFPVSTSYNTAVKTNMTAVKVGVFVKI